MPLPESRERSFERTFADLAYTRLRDKAPGLLNHLLGFQLIQKDDDDTRAVGIFGFQLGDDMLLAPMFFLNGELKGHELLYVKSRDSFVPLQENWVNYLLNRRPQILGEEEKRPMYELGLRNPDLSSYKRPLAEEKIASVSEALKSAENFDDQKYAGLDIGLPRFLEKAGNLTAQKFFKLLMKNAEFTEAVLKFYDNKDFENLKFTDMVKEAAVAETGVVFIDAGKPSMDRLVLSEEEQTKLAAQGWLVVDKRAEDQKAQVFMNKMAESITTPDTDGFYDVLMADGSKRTFLVTSGGTAAQKDYSSGGGCGGGADFGVFLIDPKKKRVYKTSRQSVYVTKSYSLEEMRKITEELPDADSAKPHDLVVFIGHEGRSTKPYEILRKLSGMDGRVEYEVGDYCYGIRPLTGTRLGNIIETTLHPSVNETVDINKRHEEVRRVIITPKVTTRYTVTGDTLFVPADFKIVKLTEDDNGPTAIGEEYKEKEGLPNLASSPEIALKFASDIENGLWKELQIRKVGSSFVVFDNKRGGEVESATKTARRLICGYGLGEGEAVEMLKGASNISDLEAKKWWVKLPMVKTAQGVPLDSPVFDDPIQPANRWSGVPTYYPDIKEQQLGQQSMLGNKQQYYTNDPDLDPSMRRSVMDAADKDQKEVLDAAMIQGLVKTNDSDAAVESYLPDLLLALDRIGRILFLYYWHNDKFKDKYGQQDMMELEDSLRNVFKSLGDLTLFLKQKTIEPEGEMAGDVRLDEVLG